MSNVRWDTASDNTAEQGLRRSRNSKIGEKLMGIMKDQFIDYLEAKELDEPLAQGDLALELVEESDSTITFRVVQEDENLS